MKKFKTLSEQRQYLIDSKNLIDDDIIDNILLERPYASLINPYKKFFYTSIENDIHIYDDKTSIKDYYKLASLDDLIAKELHYKIGVFERRIKGAFAYILSEKMNSIGDPNAVQYVSVFKDPEINIKDFKLLGFNDFRTTYDKSLKTTVQVNQDTQTYRKKLLMSMADIDDNKKRKNRLFKKYIKHNNPIPFWLVVHTLSLGDLVSLYEMLGKELKNSILEYLNNNLGNPIFKDTIFKFEQDLNIIKELRNIINHYEPLYEFIRSVPKGKVLYGINRIKLYSTKILDASMDSLLENLPKFRNNDNDDTLDVYQQLIK